jgi:hypothetical protein
LIADYEDEFFGTVSKAILTLTDVVFMAVWHSDIFPPEKEEYLLAPFFLFVILTSFGVTNIIVGVIVDATFLTRERLQWKEKRGRLQDMGQLWEERIVGTGLSLEGVESASLNYKLRLQEERRHLITGILDSIVNRPDFDFPPGLTAEELYEVFDPVGDGRVNHENFVIGMGRLLLNNPFQNSVMGLVDLAINRSHLGALRHSIDDISARVACLEGVKASLASLERSVHNIERRMNASAEDASPHLTGGSSIRSASEPL